MIAIIKHISIEGPGIIGEFFENMTWEIKTFELDKGDRLPEELWGIDAIISLGGPMGVYEEDKYPFLRAEDKFLKNAIKEEIPILGICLGAQLLAKVCGAKVKKAQHEEIGWYKIGLTEEGQSDPLFKGIDKELDVFQWHEDTFEIPENGILLASSKLCKNQAFRFGVNAYGFQFHIEVTPDMIGSWIEEYLNSDKGKITDTQKILKETFDKKEQFARQANKVLLNFFTLIAEKAFVEG